MNRQIVVEENNKYTFRQKNSDWQEVIFARTIEDAVDELVNVKDHMEVESIEFFPESDYEWWIKVKAWTIVNGNYSHLRVRMTLYVREEVVRV